MKILDLGLIEYKEAYKIQKELVEKRDKKLIPDTLVILEHPPVVTIGKLGTKKNILEFSEKIEIIETDRGGDVTCHCPGQIVGYPIFDLKERGKDIHKYLRDLEEVFIQLLKKYDIDAGRRKGYTGVWVGENKKIVSLGVGVKHWITYHGFAFNVNPDLSYFNTIVPCGINGVEMVSLEKLLGKKIDVKKVKSDIINSFLNVFDLENAGRASSATTKEIC
ncbi:MAG: lipoyl(octanoyl) transferase LipB [Elusimicrobia bacterium]|nr:lipoyl(octanoyl) transferase LipB [Elusimicrobiota bacterium]